jgi:dihydroxyacetone kinase-like predicted kinase
MTERGQVSEVHIHNMRLQSEQRRAGLEEQGAAGAFGASGTAGATGAAGASGGPAIAKNHGLIAVASGSGMEKILRSLGVDEVVSGGQTMNPSTKDLLDATERVAAEHIFILPNNKNIILAANAAAEVSEKSVRVIPTRSVPQSFSALFVVDQDASFEENFERMNEAIEEVHFAEVTTAIKNAKTSGGAAINSGDIIGILDDSLEVVGDDVSVVTQKLVGLLADEDADTLTILAGADLAQDDFEQLIEELEESYPDLEIDAHRGEQPLYPLVMSVE